MLKQALMMVTAFALSSTMVGCSTFEKEESTLGITAEEIESILCRKYEIIDYMVEYGENNIENAEDEYEKYTYQNTTDPEKQYLIAIYGAAAVVAALVDSDSHEIQELNFVSTVDMFVDLHNLDYSTSEVQELDTGICTTIIEEIFDLSEEDAEKAFENEETLKLNETEYHIFVNWSDGVVSMKITTYDTPDAMQEYIDEIQIDE